MNIEWENRPKSAADLAKEDRQFVGPTIQNELNYDQLLLMNAQSAGQIGSISSINSFVSANSNFPATPKLNNSPKNTQKCPISPNFLAHSPAPQQSRLSTNSSISLGASHTNQRQSGPKYYFGQFPQNSNQPSNFLTIPSFLVSPPTPKSSAISIEHHQHSSIQQFYKNHRDQLTGIDQYRYALSRAQLKASSRTSALLSGFAMIALVELIYQKTTPHFLLIILAVITTLLVSVHLLTLLMSTCLLPYIEANGCTKDSPHIKLKCYVELSWLFSTCIGLILFLLEICIIFFVKFEAIGFDFAAWIMTGILLPVLALFLLISYQIRRTVLAHFEERMADKLFCCDFQQIIGQQSANLKLANGRGIWAN